MSMSVSGSEIKCLTSLLGIAAMAVVIEHFSATTKDYAARIGPWNVAPLFVLFHVGAVSSATLRGNLFFVFSMGSGPDAARGKRAAMPWFPRNRLLRRCAGAER